MNNLKNNQSIQKYTDQLVRNYEVTVSSKKKEVLSTIFNKIEKTEVAQPKKGRKISLIPFATISAAASVAVLLAFYFFTASITIKGDIEGAKVCAYPDGSRIILQGDSEIEYKKYIRNRKVKLQGIAYFEVEKGSKFQVKTNLGTVAVLGTRFLVNDSKDSMIVQCFEGSVKASINETSSVLTSGNKFIGTKTEAKTETFEKTIAYPDFAKFKMHFSKVSITEIANKLEAFFGAEIVVKNSSTRYFSGTIQTGNLESALAIVCESMQLNYTFKEKDQVLITNKYLP